MLFGLSDWWVVVLHSRVPFHTERQLLQSKTRGQPKECFVMESKEQADEHEDTGIWSTFTLKLDKHVAKQIGAKEISRSTQKELTASIGSEVSPFPMILSEQTSLDSKEASILPSHKAVIEHNSGKTRPRTLTSKGREYQCELKIKAALANDRNLLVKLRSLEYFICIYGWGGR